MTDNDDRERSTAASNEPCPVCMGDITNPHTLDCSHTFCTSCIVQWFRSGQASCPMCRDVAVHLNFPTMMERCTMLRRKARRKDASKRLKVLYGRLLRAEKKQKEANREYHDFRRSKKADLKHYRKLNSARWRAELGVRRAKVRLGLHTDKDEPIPFVRDDSSMRLRFRY